MELHIRNISQAYPGGAQALADVTLSVPVGLSALLGPHGAGKSTLMRIVAGCQSADRGRVELDEGRILLLQGMATADEIVDRFVMEDPSVVLVDEPAAGLGAAERARVLDVLRKLGEDRIVLFATHDVKDVSERCTRMAIMNRGRIVLEAEPCRAIGELHGRVWSRIISTEALPKVEREYAVISTTFLSGHPLVRVYSNTAPAVGFERDAPNLEDVYFSAVAGLLQGAELRQRG